MTGRCILVSLALLVGMAAAGAGEPPPHPSPGDRAVAFGLLLDTPIAPAQIDRAIQVADGLRRRYGLPSGDLQALRGAAARRAAEELEHVTFSPSQVACAARALGLRAAGRRCDRRCAAAARVAEIELQKATLEAWAGLAPSRPRVERCRDRRSAVPNGR